MEAEAMLSRKTQVSVKWDKVGGIASIFTTIFLFAVACIWLILTNGTATIGNKSNHFTLEIRPDISDNFMIPDAMTVKSHGACYTIPISLGNAVHIYLCNQTTYLCRYTCNEAYTLNKAELMKFLSSCLLNYKCNAIENNYTYEVTEHNSCRHKISNTHATLCFNQSLELSSAAIGRYMFDPEATLRIYYILLMT